MIFKKFVHALTFIFLLGAGLLTFFLILSGGRSGGTLKNFYWFEANTSGFNDAPDLTRWYNYRWCGYSDGQTSGCSSTVPAQAFSPRDNFGRSDEMPTSFLNNRNTYYYLSRVAWAMLLIGLFFIVLAIVPAVVIIFKTITSMAVWSTVATWIAFFFVLLSACLYTGCYAKAKSAFDGRDRYSKLGPKNFGFIWTTVFLLLLNTIWSTITVVIHGKNKYKDYRDADHYAAGAYNNSSSMDTHNDKSTYDSKKHHSNRTFFTRLRTKKTIMNSQESGEPTETVHKKQEKEQETEREGYPVDSFQQYQKDSGKNEPGFHSVESYDRILGEGQDDFNTTGKMPGSYQSSEYSKIAPSTSTTKPVQTNLAHAQEAGQGKHTNVGEPGITKSGATGLPHDKDPENVSGMYNMKLGEKTNLKTGQIQSGHREDQPLESYIPGVGRSNRASEAMFPHTPETQSGHHVSHGKEKPLEAYIPGVGRNNHPVEHAVASQGPTSQTKQSGVQSGLKSHSSEPHVRDLGSGKLEKPESQKHSSNPHIPGTGISTEDSKPMSKQRFDPKEMTAYKMDPKQTAHLSQNTAVPGFDYGNKSNVSGKPSGGADVVDRASVPKPAHLNQSADSGSNAPVRRDSRTVNQFHEPEQEMPSQRKTSLKEEIVSEFPAHSYDSSKEVGAKSSGHHEHQTVNPSAAPGGNRHDTTLDPSIKEESTTSGFGHEAHHSHHGKTNIIGHESHGSEHEMPKDFGKDSVQTGEKTAVFGHEHHAHGHTHGHAEGTSHSQEQSHTSSQGREKKATAEELSTGPGPTMFGKTINFGSSHKGREQEISQHGTKAANVENAPRGGTGATAAKLGHADTHGVESKHLPSKTATTSDQPVKIPSKNEPTGTANRTGSIGSEEAGSYAREVGNHPSLVDPSVPTYRHKEQITSSASQGGEYQVHSTETSYTRKVSVGEEGSHPHHEHHSPQIPTVGERKDEQAYTYNPESIPRSHLQEQEEQREHSKKESEPGLIEKVKNTITGSHHS